MEDEAERQRGVEGWLRAHAELDRSAWLHQDASWLSLDADGRLSSSAGSVTLDDAQSLWLSRWDRPLPRHWLARLLRRRAPRRPTVGVRLRSARETLYEACFDCDDAALLERLPWHPMDAGRVPLGGLCTASVFVLEHLLGRGAPRL